MGNQRLDHLLSKEKSLSSFERLTRRANGLVAQLWLERTPDKREVGGSSPPRPIEEIGGVAQLGEHLPCTQEVIGSNPFASI